MNGNRHTTGKRIAWWLTWTVLTGHLVLLPLLLGVHLSDNAASGFGWRVGFLILPLAIATGLRWLVLSRMASTIPAFFVSLAGLILTDMSGLTAVFLEPPHRLLLYVVCVAGMLQLIPLFILKKTHRDGQANSGDVPAAPS